MSVRGGPTQAEDVLYETMAHPLCLFFVLIEQGRVGIFCDRRDLFTLVLIVRYTYLTTVVGWSFWLTSIAAALPGARCMHVHMYASFFAPSPNSSHLLCTRVDDVMFFFHV